LTPKDDAREEKLGDLLRRVVLASVGAAAIGKDELEEFLRRAREQGDLSSADAEKLRDKLMEAFKRVPGDWDEIVDTSLRAALRRIKIPDRAEIERLQKVIDRLARKIDAMERELGKRGPS
jgi:polyhydroxyalkanoate synthesis regulator phasin